MWRWPTAAIGPALQVWPAERINSTPMARKARELHPKQLSPPWTAAVGQRPVPLRAVLGQYAVDLSHAVGPPIAWTPALGRGCRPHAEASLPSGQMLPSASSPAHWQREAGCRQQVARHTVLKCCGAAENLPLPRMQWKTCRRCSCRSARSRVPRMPDGCREARTPCRRQTGHLMPAQISSSRKDHPEVLLLPWALVVVLAAALTPQVVAAREPRQGDRMVAS